MSLGYSNWLSIKVWISEVFGSPVLALIVALICVNYLVVKNNISSKTGLVLNLLMAFAFLGFYFSQAVLVLVGVILVFIIFGVYSAFWR